MNFRHLYFSLFLTLFCLAPGLAEAATLYAKAAGGNWNAATTWSNVSSAGSDDSGPPAAADDVVLDAGSGNVAVNVTTNNLRSFDMTGYTGTLSGGINDIVVIGAAAASVPITFAGTITWTGRIVANPTASTTVITITSNGKTIRGMLINGNSSGQVTLADAFTTTSADTVTLAQGTFKVDGAADNSGLTHSWGIFSSSNSNTRTIALGNSTLTLTASATAWNTSVVANLTVDANTATVNLTGTSVGIISSAKHWNGMTLSFTGGGTINMNTTGSTFANVSVTGTAVKTDILRIYTSAFVVTGVLSLNGNSVTNRLLVSSDVLGTRRNITNSGATMNWSNVDFRDIGLVTAYGASAITGLSGDAQGNSNITFTTPATQTWQGTSGGNWSDVTKWTSRVPLPQDDVVISSAFSSGQTITVNMPRLGKNIDMSGATWTGTAPIWNTTGNNGSIFGSLSFPAGITYTTAAASLTFEGRGSHTVNQNGAVITTTATTTFQSVGGAYTLASAYSGGNGTITHNNGGLNGGGFNVTAGIFNSSNSNTRTLTLGSGTWTMTGTGIVWTTNITTGLTLISTGSTVVLSNITGSPKTFRGGGSTYNNVTFSGDNITVDVSNTFTGTFAVNNAGYSNGLILTSGTTQTLTGTSNVFTTNGSAGSLAILASSAGGSAATLSAPNLRANGQVVFVDYMSIQDSTVTETGIWYAGTHSTNVSGNTNWIWTSPHADDMFMMWFQ